LSEKFGSKCQHQHDEVLELNQVQIPQACFKRFGSFQKLLKSCNATVKEYKHGWKSMAQTNNVATHSVVVSL
jgi:hypothetical protein